MHCLYQLADNSLWMWMWPQAHNYSSTILTYLRIRTCEVATKFTPVNAASQNKPSLLTLSSLLTTMIPPTNHLPPRLRRLLQRQQDSNIAERSDSALPPVKEPASTAISRAKSNTPAIMQPPSPRRKRNRRSRKKESRITSPIALKRRHRTCARLDHCIASTTHATID
ncbi:hypothetical protein BDR05DRAFT_247635 [Suillus weaverae]|nr:hypothetical protein BDR05DRAFT_247635 [Suillus weaverae]